MGKDNTFMDTGVVIGIWDYTWNIALERGEMCWSDSEIVINKKVAVHIIIS